MYILAVDSSAVSAGAALLKDGKLVCETYVNTGYTHSETLMPLIDSVLKLSNIILADIDYFAVAVGPGSFTGIRIGVAAVKGLCFADSKKCFAVSTLEALANCADIGNCVICPVMDAKRMQVYCAAFEKKGDRIERMAEDAPRSLEELSAYLKKFDRHVVLVGDGSDLAYDFLSKNGVNTEKFSEVFKFQHASGVAITAYRNYNIGVVPVTADALRPVYLRLSQAERNFHDRKAE